MTRAEFTARLAAVANDVHRHLDLILAPQAMSGEVLRPGRLIDAMRHAALAGGKRIRPFLLIEAARMCGVSGLGPLNAAAALELVHCYSLIHDDLPAMDDDDVRRGQPTVHRAFDEATAILAGDGLLTMAFQVMADSETSSSDAVKVQLIAALAAAAGAGGMAGGQILDLAAEGRFHADYRENHGEARIVLIQSMKTGALIRFACEAGALLAGPGEGAGQALASYGSALGLAFQIKDDLLDAEGDAETLGKAAGKDAKRGKATFVDLLGAAGAAARLRSVGDDARAALAPFGDKANALLAMVDFNAERTS